MTCEEALKLLYEVIDKEANQIDSEIVKKHLEDCQHCMARYEFEVMFKTFVTEKGASRNRTDLLKQRIQDRISDAGESGSRFQLRSFRSRPVIISAAAALVLCVVAALATAQFFRHKSFVYPFEKEHFNAHPVNFAAVNDDDCIKEINGYLTPHFSLALGEKVAGYELTHYGIDEIRGHKFMHLHYRNGTSKVSLFIGQYSPQNLPDFEKVIHSGIEYFRHVCLQCQVVYWKQGNAVAIAVSENKELDLPQLASALGAI